MTISARTSANKQIIGYVNTDYSSLSYNAGARRFNVSSSIGSDIDPLINTTDEVFIVAWSMVFAFSALPAAKVSLEYPLQTAEFGSVSVVRSGQQTDDFKLRYQTQKSRLYGYNPGVASASYPRGRVNLPNIGVTAFAVMRSYLVVGSPDISGDAMYILSPFVELGEFNLLLQIQYICNQVADPADYYMLDS